MLLPPAVDDPEEARPYFRALSSVRERLLARGVDRSMLSELSMGMSHDFEVAVEEGATLVRVGYGDFREPDACLTQPCRRSRRRSTADQGRITRMNVSSLDLRQQRFRSRLRGFDKVEVTSFLVAVADDYEQALRETDRLRQELAQIEADRSTSTASSEKNLQNTLMTAQKLADDIKEQPSRKAQRIVREAEGRADLLLEKTQARLEDIQREIDASS